MSARSARALAAQRAVKKPKKTSKGTVATTGEESDLGVGDALLSIIPTEALAFYTPVSAAVIGFLLKDTAEDDRFMGLRWGLFVATIVLAMALVAKDKLAKTQPKWPAAEMAAAGIAFAAWALVTPESPLLAETREEWDGVLVVLISLGAIAVLGFFSSVKLTSKA